MWAGDSPCSTQLCCLLSLRSPLDPSNMDQTLYGRLLAVERRWKVTGFVTQAVTYKVWTANARSLKETILVTVI